MRGLKAARPCRYCSHWQSATSVFRPGTFFTCRAFTNRLEVRGPPGSGIRDPEYTSGLHRNALNTALLRPSGNLFEFAGERCEAAHRLRIAIRGYGHEDPSCADVNSRRIGFHNPGDGGIVGSWRVLSFRHMSPP